MTAEAQERLQAIQEATELGAGFRIAMRDLEIRGAGNLLGAEQSGHIAAVGFDLYSRLLEQAVKTMKAQLVATNYRGPTEDERRTRNDETLVCLTEAGRQRTKEEGLALADANNSAALVRPPPPRPPVPPPRRQPSVKVDEKVLISPLVTLDLPLDAYLP